jgi:hypothetical protein
MIVFFPVRLDCPTAGHRDFVSVLEVLPLAQAAGVFSPNKLEGCLAVGTTGFNSAGGDWRVRLENAASPRLRVLIGTFTRTSGLPLLVRLCPLVVHLVLGLAQLGTTGGHGRFLSRF